MIPNYAPHFSDHENRLRLRKAKADIPFLLFVVPENEPKATPMAATGLFNADKSILTLTAKTSAGPQVREWYADVLTAARKRSSDQ